MVTWGSRYLRVVEVLQKRGGTLLWRGVDDAFDDGFDDEAGGFDLLSPRAWRL